MFEDNITTKRLLKRKSYMEALEKAKEENNDFKVRQLEGKIAMFNRKHYPENHWNSKEKGTYVKKEIKK